MVHANSRASQVGPPARSGRVPSLHRSAAVLTAIVFALVVLPPLRGEARKSKPQRRGDAAVATSTTLAIPSSTNVTSSGSRVVPTTTRTTRVAAGPATTRVVGVNPRSRSIGFRTTGRLRQHYLKHGAEFGSITEADYLRLAQELRDAPLSNRVIEAFQPGGTISRFDRRTGGFVAFDNDLVIRTFFRPNDGEAYFRRAAQRRN